MKINVLNINIKILNKDKKDNTDNYFEFEI